MAGRLPRDETAFFGRAAELTEIARRRAAGTRLVTLVGIGGVGKTRLAVAHATTASEPAIFVQVAAPLEAAVRAIARAADLHVKATPGSAAALASLAGAAPRLGAALLVLDGVEVLGASARDLATALLDEAPDLRILATSTSPLDLRGEAAIVVPPLAEADAQALLRDRASIAVGDALRLDDADALALVRRLDGLPLAIELVAPHLEVLSPAQLLARLDGGPIQRSLSAALDRSWDLLVESERRALTQASVFAAPFDIDAAEDVIDLPDVLGALEGLVRRSLLLRSPVASGVRLSMLRTVRAWAASKLGGDARATSVRRHALHHLARAEAAARAAYGEEGAASLDLLAELAPELLQAQAAVAQDEPAASARIVLALADLRLFRGMLAVPAELFDEGKAAAARSGDASLHARALVARARVILETGRTADAEADLREALELATQAGDDVTRAEATRSLGWALLALGRTEDAEARIAEAKQLHQAQGSPRGLADADVALGILRALQGRRAEALERLRAALAIHVAQGDLVRQEKVLGFAQLAGLDAKEVARGLPRDVLVRAPEPPAELGEAHERWQQAIALYRRGARADERGDGAAAITSFDAAIEVLSRAGIARGVAVIHAHAGATLAETGDAEDAAARLERARAATVDSLEEGVVSLYQAAADVRSGAARDRAPARALLERVTRGEVVTPELGIAARVLSRALDTGGPRTSRSSRTSHAGLVVGPESRWMSVSGARTDLVRYGPARRVLDRLVVARLEQPGTALSAAELIEAGWPGERMRHSAGLLRVYSVVRRLRRLGLEPILITRDDGYLLDPNASVRPASTER